MPYYFKRMSSILTSGNAILVLALFIVCIVMSLVSPFFLTIKSLLEATRFIAEIGFISLGMALVILTGGIDLSVGSVFAMSAIVVGVLVQSGLNVFVAALAGLASGTIAGTINGLIVSKIRIPPIIVTLGTMAVYRGVAIGISMGHSYHIPESFYFLGQGDFYGLPSQLIALVICASVMAGVLRLTGFGRTLFALGNNEEAARFSGLRVERAKTLAFSISGFLCSFAAIVFVSRVISAKADFGVGYELDAITIVVLGGASLFGGRANILGTILGLLIIGFTRRGLSMAFVPLEVQTVLIGAILIVSVTLNQALKGRQVHRDEPKAETLEKASA